MFLMTYLKIFFKIPKSRKHRSSGWKTPAAAIAKEIPRGRHATAVAAAAVAGVAVVVVSGNKSKMDFLGVRCVAGVASSGGERKHLPVYSRLAVTRQPSSDRLVRHESCSAPSVIRPYVLKARTCVCVCVCVCVGVSWVPTCVSATPRYQPFYCRQPTGELLFLLPLLPLPLRPLSFRLLNLPFPSLSPSSRPRCLSLPSRPSLRTRKGWGGKKSRRRHFLGEIRMYVPPYPDLLRGIRRVQGRRGAETAWPLNVDVDCGLLKMSYVSRFSLVRRHLRANEVGARGGKNPSMNFWLLKERPSNGQESMCSLKTYLKKFR